MTKKQEKTVLTRAQKTEATKGLIKEVLAVKFMRHNELIDEVAKRYVERYEGEDTENINDVKGRVGSVLDIMKKESEVGLVEGAYALKARTPMPRPQKAVEETPTEPAEAPAPKKRGRAKKAVESKEEAPQTAEEKSQENEKETPAPKKRTRAKKTVDKSEGKPEEKAAPAQEEKAEETPAPKKRGRKAKTAKTEAPAEPASNAEAGTEPSPKAEEKPVEVAPKAIAPQKEEPPTALAVQPKAEVARQGVVMDMSFLFGDKAVKPTPKKEESPKKEETPALGQEEKKAAPAPQKQAQKQEQKSTAALKATVSPKKEQKPATQRTGRTRAKKEEKPLTADEKLKESFLEKLRSLGGDYFEYYSVYLLERYSLRNGRRLEGLKINGGDRDGGIDGEIELTDKLGFKETIYIQSKNWDPDKGRGSNWVVGETLLQQFIGACVCRQAKEGKPSCRGIFMTTSRFTPDAKKILEELSDKLIGYDGGDIYETAKECSFGLVQKNGEWALDENLLSGVNAFFRLY